MPFFHPCSRRWLGIGLADGSSCPSGAARGGGLGSSRASDAEVDSDDGGFGSAGKSEQER
uniref:Uncharacterized protein n=1 Tax=Oryza rufipogon TaxID=4529 RepID=A0A0E0N0V8_ORYRU